MWKSIFEFNDYKTYLRQRFPSAGEGRGLRTQLAEHLNCQVAYVSKVLNADAHFSLEQSIRISEFLDHTAEEQEYLVLLVSLARAGSKALEEHYLAQLRVIDEKRKEIRSRIQSQDTLKVNDQMIYYSSWYYGAIHVLVSIPEFRSRGALAKKLNISAGQLEKYLSFLVRSGILVEKNGEYRVGSARLHLDKRSPLIAKHHSNWRMRAIDSLDREGPTDLHYSLAFSISRSDAEKIRDILMRTIERMDEIFKPSPEEGAYSLVVDFFGI